MRGRIALVIAGAVMAAAITQAQTRIDGFRGVVTGIPAVDGSAVTVDLIRWSTDAERQQVMDAIAKGDNQATFAALAAIPTLGYLWTREVAGYQIRYAHQIKTPDGGERIILVTDRKLGAKQMLPWLPAGRQAEDYPFTLVEFRLDKAGNGEGKSSLTGKIVVDPAAKTLTLENWAAVPVMLREAKRIGRTS